MRTRAALVFVLSAAAIGCSEGHEGDPTATEPALSATYEVDYSGQGTTADGFGGYDLNLELCGVANGADVDGPYLLWVLTATQATSAQIVGPWGTAAMSQSGSGTFKYISGWYNPNDLDVPGAVKAFYTGKKSNAQLTISHGCRPFTKKFAWCSPGFWGQSHAAGAWALTGVSMDASFDGSVVPRFYGTALDPDATLGTVITTTGGTYKTPAVAGDLTTLCPLTPFNAAGAYLSNNIPGYQFDCSVLSDDDSQTCPLDSFGNWKQ